MTNESFEALLQENRTFSASDDFKKKAAIKDPGIYQTAANDRLKFWESFANDLHWFQPWDATLEWNIPLAASAAAWARQRKARQRVEHPSGLHIMGL